MEANVEHGMETIIEAKNLHKIYRISKRASGLFGHLANLFYPRYIYKNAIDGINLTIKRGDAVGLSVPMGQVNQQQLKY